MNTFSVITVPADQCQTSAAIRVLPTQGMLASIVTTETGCGARNHPWVIEVEPSQKINLTLFDFFARESPSSSHLPCTEYVVLREDLTGEVESVCRGVERVRHIYTSTTNRLEVEFPHAQSNTDVYFAVYYEGEFCFSTPLKRQCPHFHDDVIKWKHFSCYRPFVRGIHRSPVNSPNKGQWRGALMFSLICAWTNGWANNRDACERPSCSLWRHCYFCHGHHWQMSKRQTVQPTSKMSSK